MWTFKGLLKDNKNKYAGKLLFTKDEIIDFSVLPIHEYYNILSNFIISKTDRSYKIKPLAKNDPKAIEHKSRFEITYKVRPKERDLLIEDIKDERMDYLELDWYNEVIFRLLHDRYILFQDGKFQTGLWFIIGLTTSILISNALTCNKVEDKPCHQYNNCRDSNN